MKSLLLAAVIILGWQAAFAQEQYHPTFPQAQIQQISSHCCKG